MSLRRKIADWLNLKRDEAAFERYCADHARQERARQQAALKTALRDPRPFVERREYGAN